MITQRVKIQELPSIVDAILKEYPNQKLFALQGEMGAGKTSFSKVFCKALSVDDEVSSPTFAIANIYDSNKYGEVYHFDFYRLENAQEALEIGFEDYVYSGNYCLMEWPELIYEYIPKPFVEISIKHTDNNDIREFVVRLIE